MSVKVSNKTVSNVNVSGQDKDAYGLPVDQQKTDGLTVTGATSRNKSYGVRVPVLSDIDKNYIGRAKATACRFDIVEKVTTVIKPGSYGPDHGGVTMIDAMSNPNENVKKLEFARQPTFHSVGTSLTRSDTSIVDRIGPYHWSQRVRSSKEGDARDVLYRNTYCLQPDDVRYRSLTLPRLMTPSQTERPWTVSGDDNASKRNIVDHGEYSKIVTVVPRQPRGTVVKFSEMMKPAVYKSDGHSLEVRRINSRQAQRLTSPYASNHLPLIRHDTRQAPRIQERPLKFENSRYYKVNKGTLFTKHILPAYKHAFDRDYSSADTFKEYLESLQHTAQANTPGMHSREVTRFLQDDRNQMSSDYHARVLQSVSDVNKPSTNSASGVTMPMPSNIKVEIKQSARSSQPADNILLAPKKTRTIDNLSSVRGSVVNEPGATQSMVPISSSVVGKQGVAKLASVVSDNGLDNERETRDDVTKQHEQPHHSEAVNKAPSIAGSEKAPSEKSDKRRMTPMPQPLVLPTATVDDEDEEGGASCPVNTPNQIVIQTLPAETT